MPARTTTALPGRAARARMRITLLLLLVLPLPATVEALEVEATGRLLAGLTTTPPPGVRISATALQDFARSTSNHWSEYERRIGEPMQKWALAEVRQTKGETVFYPFSGPDFATVYHFYPEAGRYVLVALQRAQPLPPLEKASAAEIATFMSRFAEAWKQFAHIGFFRTNDLDDDAKQAGIRIGITAPLTAFAARIGFKIVGIAPVRVNAEGTNLELHPGDRADVATWDSVRISLERDGRKVELEYVRVNLSDASLNANPAVRAWIERMAANRTLLKAASHLLQNPRFTIVRDALLNHAPSIVQDETGIEYTQLAKAFEVKLYGNFSKPHPIFNQESQRALAHAYKSNANVRPLPFRVSYQRQPEANLQVAVRTR
jgi:hypothetical protein